MSTVSNHNSNHKKITRAIIPDRLKHRERRPIFNRSLMC